MFALKFASYAHLILEMPKFSRNLRAYSWCKFSWTEMICVKKLTLCNSAFQEYLAGHMTMAVSGSEFFGLQNRRPKWTSGPFPLFFNFRFLIF